MYKRQEENGPFTSRRQLLKVPKLGPKAFQQCAGFLRVPDSSSPLDNTAVHPESYPAAERLLSLTGHAMADVAAGKLGDLNTQVQHMGTASLAEQCGVGVPTLLDVIRELQKPGRDPRDELPPPLLRTDVMSIKDLKPGMVLTGTVRNVIDFGVFVDIGVHQDGLVHISQITDKFLKHPSQAVSRGRRGDGGGAGGGRDAEAELPGYEAGPTVISLISSGFIWRPAIWPGAFCCLLSGPLCIFMRCSVYIPLF